LRRIADSFLAEHNASNSIPVPIEHIVEFRLGMDVVPEPGLHQTFSIDSFLSGDCTEIRVDEHVWQKRPERYRFSLAHEVSHSLIHRDIISKMRSETVSEWKAAVATIPEDQYSFIEWQAYCLAGLILVPTSILAEQVSSVTEKARSAGLDIAFLTDNERSIIESNLGRHFAVSREVIRKRMGYDKLWS
jgi:hypothetical protein